MRYEYYIGVDLSKKMIRFLNKYKIPFEIDDSAFSGITFYEDDPNFNKIMKFLNKNTIKI